MIFDTHAHYDDDKFDDDREKVLTGLKDHGVGTVVNVGSDLKTSENSLYLAQKYPFIYAAIGVHPSDIACLDEDTFPWLKKHVHDPKVVAVGEIGLDYYWEKDDGVRRLQRAWFERQFSLAYEENMPVIIHSREAAQDTYDILKSLHAEDIPVVIHCFSYSEEMAERFLDMGCYLGIGGVVTFNNAKKLKEVAKNMPIDKLLLETDCPYLAPEPNRGKRNDSTHINYVVDEIAALRGMDREEVIDITEKNARRFYSIG